MENETIKQLRKERQQITQKIKEERKKAREEKFKQKAIKKVMRAEKKKEKLQLKINYHERLLKGYQDALTKLCFKEIK